MRRHVQEGSATVARRMEATYRLPTFMCEAENGWQ